MLAGRRQGGGGSEKICVFKPRDEEPNAINNPKGQTSHAAVGAPGLKGGIRVGDAALNEWAGTPSAIYLSPTYRPRPSTRHCPSYACSDSPLHHLGLVLHAAPALSLAHRPPRPPPRLPHLPPHSHHLPPPPHTAYLLDSTDRARHFSRVPPTWIVRIEHSAFFDADADGMAQPGSSPFRARKTKVGSLQQFVHHDGFAEDYSPSVFSDLEVQRIAVFDVRTFNTDRHGANLLALKPGTATPNASRNSSPPSGRVLTVQQQQQQLFADFEGGGSAGKAEAGETAAEDGSVGGGEGGGPAAEAAEQSGGSGFGSQAASPREGHRLVPIDHGFCLPAAITVPCFEWAHWKQAKQPMTPEVLAYIAAIDIDADAQLLTQQFAPIQAPSPQPPPAAASPPVSPERRPSVPSSSFSPPTSPEWRLSAPATPERRPSAPPRLGVDGQSLMGVPSDTMSLGGHLGGGAGAVGSKSLDHEEATAASASFGNISLESSPKTMPLFTNCLLYTF